MGLIPPGTELAPHNPGVKPWDELTENEKKFAARLQEAFAAFLDHTDAQIGRLVEFIESMGDLDNTHLMVMSDNGASQEGGATGVMDEMAFFHGLRGCGRDPGPARRHRRPPQPFQLPLGLGPGREHPAEMVQAKHLWRWGARPAHHPLAGPDQGKGGIRGQFHHVTDIAPTLYELLGIEMPESFGGYEQIPIAGTSMAYTFDDKDAPTRKRVQYFEMFGHRGLWADGWKAVTRRDLFAAPSDTDEDRWELYYLPDDFSECNDLADEHPDKVERLVELWWEEMERHGGLPYDVRTLELFQTPHQPHTPHQSHRYRYVPPVSHLPAEVRLQRWQADPGR